MRILTVGWKRGEQIGFMPPESDLVYPDPALTILWRPVTTATIVDDIDVDLDPDDPSEPQGPNPTTPSVTPGGDPVKVEFGPPAIIVVKRRTERLFLKHGLVVDIKAPALAAVKAVLTARVARSEDDKEKRRRVKITETVEELIGPGRSRLRLHVSGDGRRALRAASTLPCTLELVVRYAGQDPLKLKRSVMIVERKR